MERNDGDRSLSPASPLRFNYRRIVGGTRLLLTQASPWKLLFQSRVDELKHRLVEEVTAWAGVESAPHRFGGIEFLLAGREIGHVHDWGLFDAPLMRPIGDAVVEAGDAGRHHILPDSGWVTTFIEDETDWITARSLLRLSYLWHASKYTPVRGEHDMDAITEEVVDLPLGPPVAETFITTLQQRL